MSERQLYREIVAGLQKIRSWWKNRNVAEEIAETVFQHSKKVAKAAKIYSVYFPHLDREKIITMAKIHDFAEYKAKDYIPWEISEEEKHEKEKAVMIEIRDRLGEKGQKRFDIWMEYEAWITEEAKIVKQLDKLDAAIQAIEYEKMWYDNMWDFFPYTLSKLEDPALIKTLKILLKKEYFQVSTYEQYFLLLSCGGNEEIFRDKMEEKYIWYKIWYKKNY